MFHQLSSEVKLELKQLEFNILKHEHLIVLIRVVIFSHDNELVQETSRSIEVPKISSTSLHHTCTGTLLDRSNSVFESPREAIPQVQTNILF